MANDFKFEWDPEKEEKNNDDHNVSFPEASTIFCDDNCITIPDEDHSLDEERYITIGCTNFGKLLTVCATDRGDFIRIILGTRRRKTGASNLWTAN